MIEKEAENRVLRKPTAAVWLFVSRPASHKEVFSCNLNEEASGAAGVCRTEHFSLDFARFKI
jgi:hypothetical protein